MTQNEVLHMAIAAGATDCANPDKWGILEIRDTDLERFAKLVAAHEREECAKVCDDEGEWDSCCRNLARQIRARGEK